jgi:hypothetical protein
MSLAAAGVIVKYDSVIRRQVERGILSQQHELLRYDSVVDLRLHESGSF